MHRLGKEAWQRWIEDTRIYVHSVVEKPMRSSSRGENTVKPGLAILRSGKHTVNTTTLERLRRDCSTVI